MSMLIIENGQVKQSITSPLHDEVNHIGLALAPPESYLNSLGNTDNFMTKVEAGGTATETVATHEMLLEITEPATGYAAYLTKDTYTLSARPIAISFKLSTVSLELGSQNYRTAYIGFKTDFSTRQSAEEAAFYFYAGSEYRTCTTKGSRTDTTISKWNAGDVFTIIATSSVIIFYVNGVKVAEHSTNVPSGALYIGASVRLEVASGDKKSMIGISMIGIRRY